MSRDVLLPHDPIHPCTCSVWRCTLQPSATWLRTCLAPPLLRITIWGTGNMTYALLQKVKSDTEILVVVVAGLYLLQVRREGTKILALSATQRLLSVSLRSSLFSPQCSTCVHSYYFASRPAQRVQCLTNVTQYRKDMSLLRTIRVSLQSTSCIHLQILQ